MRNVKWAIILIFLSMFELSSCAVGTKDKIIGKWKVFDSKGEQGFFVFDKFGYAKMIEKEEVVGGKRNQGLSLKYKTDYSSDPNTLDLIIYNENSGEVIGRMASIIKFITPDKINIGH